MTQEEKDLLLKDLCGRLPHGIKAAFFDIEGECENFDIVEYIDVSNKEHEVGIGQYCLPIDKIKPYLFPLSSMSERQKKELLQISNFNYDIDEICDDFIIFIERTSIDIIDIANFINWLNAHHFDYRGLIPMGLAIDCTNLNIY